MHGLFWSIVLVTIWPSLRPARTVTRAAIAVAGPSGLPRVPTGTLVLSLATFNAVFALQNALDIAFLWSGAALPGQVPLAAYAHRSASKTSDKRRVGKECVSRGRLRSWSDEL